MLNIKRINMRDICFFFLCFFLFDGAFHTTRFIFGGSNIGRLAILGVMMFMVFLSWTSITIKMNNYYYFIFLLTGLLFFGLIKTLILDGDINFATSYITGFVYLLYLPILNYLVNDKRSLERILLAVTIIGSLVSVLGVLVLLFSFGSPLLYHSLVNFLYEHEIAVIIASFGVTVRVILSGVVFQVAAIFIGIYRYISSNKKKRNLIFLGINILAVYITYSRALIVGTILGICLLICFSRQYTASEKRRFRGLLVITVIAMIIIVLNLVIGGGKVGGVVEYLFDRLFGRSNDTNVSGVFREHMMEMIYEKILKAPIFGHGLGGHIDLRDGTIEMTYHDIIIKMGIVGLISFVLPYFYMFFSIRKKKIIYLQQTCLICALTSIMCATYYNPYLITSTGLFIYCLCIRVFLLKESLMVESDSFSLST